jgi:catechol 2,3-dioxygenase
MSIHPHTTIGAVYLTVADLSRSLTFYQQNIGFRLQWQENGLAYLGVRPHTPLLVLHERPGARPARRVTGLYHFAILVPSRLHLAHSLHHLAETQTPLQGFSDHLVSEAIYLADPDGNGIEIYRDRPRQDWYDADGNFLLGNAPLDTDGILAELAGDSEEWSGLHPDTVIGHIHLHVAHIPPAEQFYTGVLGFDLMARYGPTASFVSAGGYHHHIAFNTWAGVGAPQPAPDSVGLRWYEIQLPDTAALEEVADRIRQAGLPLEERPDGLFVRDPAQNGILLTTSQQQSSPTQME